MKTIFSFLAYILALSTLEYVTGAFDPRIVCAINALRIKNKLPALVNNEKLNVAAYVHAHRLASSEAPLSYISNNTNPGQRLDKYGFNWTAIAELMSNEAFPLTHFFNDPDHVRTLLSRDIDSIGVAVEQSPKGVPYVVMDFAKGTAPAKGKPLNCDNVDYDNESRLKKLTNYTAHLLQKLTSDRKINGNLTDLSSYRVKQFLGSLKNKDPYSETEFATRAAAKGLEVGNFAKFETCASYDVTKILKDFAKFSQLIPKKLNQVGISVEQSKLDNVICICAIFAPGKPETPAKTGRYVPVPSHRNEKEEEEEEEDDDDDDDGEEVIEDESDDDDDDSDEDEEED